MRHAGGIVWVRRAPFHAATNNLTGTALRRCEEQRESGDQCEGAAASRRVGKINKGCRTAREPAGWRECAESARGGASVPAACAESPASSFHRRPPAPAEYSSVLHDAKPGLAHRRPPARAAYSPVLTLSPARPIGAAELGHRLSARSSAAAPFGSAGRSDAGVHDIAGCMLYVACCRLQASCCVIYAACCTLLIACCMRHAS